MTLSYNPLIPLNLDLAGGGQTPWISNINGGGYSLINVPKLYPTADSTTAFGIFKADGATNVVNVDTTNGTLSVGSPTASSDSFSVKGSTAGEGTGDIEFFKDNVVPNTTNGNHLKVYKTQSTHGQGYIDIYTDGALQYGISHIDFYSANYANTNWLQGSIYADGYARTFGIYNPLNTSDAKLVLGGAQGTFAVSSFLGDWGFGIGAQPVSGTVITAGHGGSIRNIAQTAASFYEDSTTLTQSTSGLWFKAGNFQVGGNPQTASSGQNYSAAVYLDNALKADINYSVYSTGGLASFNHPSANTNTIQEMQRYTTSSTGTVATGFGNSLTSYLQDSTTEGILASQIATIWTTATHGATSSAITFSGTTAGGALTEWVRIVGGNVGIGSTNPSHTLEVNASSGSTIVSLTRPANNVNNFLQFVPNGANTTSNVNWLMGTNLNSDNFSFGVYDGSAVKTYFSVTDLGNVGIGLVSPQGMLEINKFATGLGPQIIMHNTAEASGNYSSISFNSTNDASNYQKGSIFYVADGSGYGRGYFMLGVHNVANGTNVTPSNATGYLVLANSGNVGIGTTSPAQLLSVGANSEFTVRSTGVMFPVQAPTASAPTYVKGGVYFDTTLNKLRVGGATAWETITSV